MEGLTLDQQLDAIKAEVEREELALAQHLANRDIAQAAACADRMAALVHRFEQLVLSQMKGN